MGEIGNPFICGGFYQQFQRSATQFHGLAQLAIGVAACKVNLP
jgi:hypothetical protein